MRKTTRKAAPKRPVNSLPKKANGGTTTVKSKKGVTTKKEWNYGALPDYKHTGKKGKTEVTLDRDSVKHIGKNGVTSTMRYSENDYVVKHKGAKGTTEVGKDKNYNKTYVKYTSNKTGKTTYKEPGKKTVVYENGGVKKMQTFRKGGKKC